MDFFFCWFFFFWMKAVAVLQKVMLARTGKRKNGSPHGKKKKHGASNCAATIHQLEAAWPCSGPGHLIRSRTGCRPLLFSFTSWAGGTAHRLPRLVDPPILLSIIEPCRADSDGCTPSHSLPSFFFPTYHEVHTSFSRAGSEGIVRQPAAAV